ncbi:hypothetical protein VPH219E481_0067 [Vibrio phage 219E48-1]|nr:hypothetical protein PODOV021v1_p0056 [Vibrio phage 219E41.2]QZI91078.1 hypothetical protein PODOV032v1_p0073 [Vibrio phage 219E41.1]
MQTISGITYITWAEYEKITNGTYDDKMVNKHLNGSSWDISPDDEPDDGYDYDKYH